MSGMSLLQGLSFNVLYLSEAADLSHPFLLSAQQIYVFISHSGLLGRIICPFSMTEAQSTFLKIVGSHFSEICGNKVTAYNLGLPLG